MHSFRLGWERVRNAEIVTTKTLAHLYAPKDHAMPQTHLSCRIGQVVALPTSPGVVARTKQLQHSAPAFADEEQPRSVEVPRHPCDRKFLGVQRDGRVIPVPYLNSLAKERGRTDRKALIAEGPPTAGRLSQICSSTKITDINASCLLDGPSAVSPSSRQRLNTPG
jgi:hypothetical protein